MGPASNPDGTFEYMVRPGAARAGRTTGSAGSAGRAPLCAGALHLGGRGDLDGIRDALARFVRHRATLAKENGKSLLHTGPEGQGSHYVLFDYAHAAAAVAELPRRERARFHDPLLEVLLQARTEGGSFLDNELRGTAFGTAEALQALHALRPLP